MHNESQQKKTTLLMIPFKVVTGIIIGLVMVLSIYIFSNYVVAAPLQQAPELSTSAQKTTDKPQWQTLDNHAHVIVYRDDSTVLSPDAVLNVFINDQYHTSVLPHTRAVELLLCPGSKEVKVALSQHDYHRFSQLSKTDGLSPTLRAGERYYFQVSLNAQGQIAAHWVPEKEAKIALAGLEPQTRTLSRVLNEHYCPEATYRINPNDVFAQHNNPSFLSAEGNRALTALVKTIHREFEEIDKVVVKIFCDVDEHKSSDCQSSQMRANNVTTLLVNSSIPSPLFIAQGRNIHCPKLSVNKPADQACFDVNQNLDVEVYGVRKQSRSSH